jgi:alpha-D-ribose 1-methylphosphonate 5-phosphate C-P lyase
MAITARLLADGQLATSETAILSPTNTVYITAMEIFNNSSTDQTVEILVRNGAGTSRRIFRVFPLKQYESIHFDGKLVLENSDTLRALTTTASQVDYVIFGGEE